MGDGRLAHDARYRGLHMTRMSIRHAFGRLAVCSLLAIASPARAAQPVPSQASRQAKVEAFVQSLHPQTGTVAIGPAKATLTLGADYSYLPAKEAQRVLSGLWNNPPDDEVLGMILPSRDPHVLLDPDSWAVVVTYTDEGYVSDEDAAKVDYDEMLKDLQRNDRDGNAERLKQGYPAVELVGWAEPPHYDSASHKLYWARDVKFSNQDGSEEGHTLNYDIRVLGRQGYLSLNAVAPIGRLAQVRADMPRLLQMTEFDDGQRYADYNASTDRLAAYGIGALVAGGIAAKAGLFAKLGIMLLALKKFVILIIAAAGALFRKLFRRKAA